MSATDWSPVCPIPIQTGTGRSSYRPGHWLGVECHQIGLGSPSAHEHRDIAAGIGQRDDGTGDRRRCRRPCTWAGSKDHLEPEPRAEQLTHEVVVALGARTRHQADPQGQTGT